MAATGNPNVLVGHVVGIAADQKGTRVILYYADGRKVTVDAASEGSGEQGAITVPAYLHISAEEA